MKQINIFYNEHLGEYIINERGIFNVEKVPAENKKKSLEEALKFISDRYKNRNLLLEMKIPEKEQEFVENYFLDNKNIDYRFK